MELHIVFFVIDVERVIENERTQAIGSHTDADADNKARPRRNMTRGEDS